MEHVQFVGVGLTHEQKRLHGLMRLDLVDLTHGEADVDQHPITWADTFGAHKRDADVTLDTRDIHLGNRIFIVHDVDNLTWNTEAHTDTSFVETVFIRPLSFAAARRPLLTDQD